GLCYIITTRYGLNGCPTAFYREMGEHLHLSGELVRQLHTEALVALSGEFTTVALVVGLPHRA
ncbi:MAG: hypothetical protein WBG05_13080, partial [Thermoanaerobaculia bacterium]